MSILRAPKIKVQYTGDIKRDMANLYLEYNQAQAKMRNEFALAFVAIFILGGAVIVWAIL